VLQDTLHKTGINVNYHFPSAKDFEKKMFYGTNTITVRKMSTKLKSNVLLLNISQFSLSVIKQNYF